MTHSRFCDYAPYFYSHSKRHDAVTDKMSVFLNTGISRNTSVNDCTALAGRPIDSSLLIFGPWSSQLRCRARPHLEDDLLD